ncbi:MAG: ABC transporter permease [Actinobacteria bacterium]|nr:ABC transporter permease [Actinomycetota bacterium]
MVPARARVRRLTLGWTVRDSLTVTKRNLLTLTRNPELVVFATIQPVLFVLMFRYVFGGAIQVPGEDYVNFLMPGIWAQAVVFGAVSTAVGLAEDLQSGLIERFRSLPMAPSAVLVGRTNADLVRDVFVIALMCVVGFLVGFRNQTDALAFLAALLLMLAFGYSMAWVFAVFGLRAPNAETAQAAAFPVMAVLVFASSAFVPTETMPGWLQVFADHQPVTAVVDAVRALVLGGPTASYVVTAVAWIVGIVVVFGTLAVVRYRRVT